MGGLTLVDTPTEPERAIGSVAGSFHPLKNVEAALQATSANSNNNVSAWLMPLDQSDMTAASATQMSFGVAAPASSMLPSAANMNGAFSISDFLVPSLQTKTWEDWQVADELNPFASGPEAQTFATDLSGLSYQFGLDGMLGSTMWDTTAGVPADQAYDEIVFDLGPANFATPTTVNIADLISGPDALSGSALSTSSPSISPMNLSLPADVSAAATNYQELALASFYGFTEQDSANDLDFESGSELSEAEYSSLSSSDEDDEDDEDDDMDESDEEDSDSIHEEDRDIDSDIADAQMDEDLAVAVAMSLEDAANRGVTSSPRPDIEKLSGLSGFSLPHVQAQAQSLQDSRRSHPVQEDPNKRRMEQVLVDRINNDLGAEHMAGLFKILKGSDVDEDEDEEMEVDLSRLDEVTLVQVYQYVETCCMQTVSSILEAEKEQERQKAIAAAAAAAAREREDALERQRRLCLDRTPELSPSYSSSSSSPSPPHPSSASSSISTLPMGSAKRSTAASTACTNYYDRFGTEQEAEAMWMSAQHKTKRKRGNNNGPACVGGGATGKGRRIQRSIGSTAMGGSVAMMAHHSTAQAGMFLEATEGSEMEDIGEDEEIDIVGI